MASFSSALNFMEATIENIDATIADNAASRALARLTRQAFPAARQSAEQDGAQFRNELAQAGINVDNPDVSGIGRGNNTLGIG